MADETPRAKPQSAGRTIFSRLIKALLVFLVIYTVISYNNRTVEPGRVRLVLFVVIDQFPAEYITRLGPLFKYGLRRIIDQGALFTNVNHEHFIAETCPGHASLITGTHPARSGITSNRWFDITAQKDLQCSEDPKDKYSPRLLLTSTLPEWLRAASSDSKVYATSGKERSAIMLGGHRADGAFWFSKKSGQIETSTYYPSRAQKLINSFKSTKWAHSIFGQSWDISYNLNDIPTSAQIYYPDDGIFPDRFPHALGGLSTAPNREFFESIYDSPFLDYLVWNFTRELVEHEQLGQDSHTDFLGISLSALDRVGHEYGPHSPEVLDSLLRIDQILGELLEYLDAEVGKDQYLLIFSSDHGIPALPEQRVAQGLSGSRLSAAEISCVQNIGNTLAKEFGDHTFFSYGFTVAANLPALLGDRYSLFIQRTAEELKKCPSVREVWTRQQIEHKDFEDSEITRRLLNNYHPTRSPDFEILTEPYFVPVQGRGLTHGTPHPYDTSVPWILYGGGIPQRSVNVPCSTVDVAPTVAELLGLSYPKNLDGVSRASLLR